MNELIIAIVALCLCVVITVVFGVLAGFLCCAVHILRAEVTLLKSTSNTSKDEFSLKEIRVEGHSTDAEGSDTERRSFGTPGTNMLPATGSKDMSQPPDLPSKPVFLQRPKAAPEGQACSEDIATDGKIQLSPSDYNIPADAVPSGQPHPCKKGGPLQTRKISFKVSSHPEEGNYTDVFDKIQSDQIQVISTSPQSAAVLPRPADSKLPVGSSSSVVQGQKNRTLVKNEGCRTLPRMSGTPSEDSTAAEASGETERRMSLPQSQLPTAKEMVELDPRKRIFRLESQKRKQSAGEVVRVATNAGDGGDDAQYSVVNMADKLKYRSSEDSAKISERPATSQSSAQVTRAGRDAETNGDDVHYSVVGMADKLKYKSSEDSVKATGSATSQSSAEVTQAGCNAESKGDDAQYSVVSMADKLKYRSSEDSVKAEGSGIPAHYTPREQPSYKVDVVVSA